MPKHRRDLLKTAGGSTRRNEKGPSSSSIQPMERFCCRVLRAPCEALPSTGGAGETRRRGRSRPPQLPAHLSRSPDPKPSRSSRRTRSLSGKRSHRSPSAHGGPSRPSNGSSPSRTASCSFARGEGDGTERRKAGNAHQPKSSRRDPAPLGPNQSLRPSQKSTRSPGGRSMLRQPPRRVSKRSRCNRARLCLGLGRRCDRNRRRRQRPFSRQRLRPRSTASNPHPSRNPSLRSLRPRRRVPNSAGERGQSGDGDPPRRIESITNPRLNRLRSRSFKRSRLCRSQSPSSRQSQSRFRRRLARSPRQNRSCKSHQGPSGGLDSPGGTGPRGAPQPNLPCPRSKGSPSRSWSNRKASRP